MKYIALLAIFLSGCTSVSAEWIHVSHPLLGPPFGPMNEEDTLDVLQGCARRDMGPVYVEMCLGQQLADSGFYGDGFIYTGRFGIKKEINRGN